MRQIMDESATPAQQWHDLCSLEELPDGGILPRLQGGEDLLVYRDGTRVMWEMGPGSNSCKLPDLAVTVVTRDSPRI